MTLVKEITEALGNAIDNGYKHDYSMSPEWVVREIHEQVGLLNGEFDPDDEVAMVPAEAAVIAWRRKQTSEFITADLKDKDVSLMLWQTILHRAKVDAAYATHLGNWLDQGGTIHLRDMLCSPFKDIKFNSTRRYPFADAWMGIDSAYLHWRQSWHTGV